MPPELQYCVYQMLSWFPGIASLPGKRLDAFITPELETRLVSCQHPDTES
jgi:hypothetical protein